jgi:hypothetical protein
MDANARAEWGALHDFGNAATSYCAVARPDSERQPARGGNAFNRGLRRADNGLPPTAFHISRDGV